MEELHCIGNSEDQAFRNCSPPTARYMAGPFLNVDGADRRQPVFETLCAVFKVWSSELQPWRCFDSRSGLWSPAKSRIVVAHCPSLSSFWKIADPVTALMVATPVITPFRGPFLFGSPTLLQLAAACDARFSAALGANL